MSRFLYFLGGCAAGALAVAAVQAFTEDDYSSTSSFSSACDDDADDDSNEHDDSTLEANSEGCTAATQGMATALSSLFTGAASAAGSTCPEGTAPDMQKMSEQLTGSVIGIVNEFLRQSQAAQKQNNTTMHSAASSAACDTTASMGDMPSKPITPNFGAAQA